MNFRLMRHVRVVIIGCITLFKVTFTNLYKSCRISWTNYVHIVLSVMFAAVESQNQIPFFKIQRFSIGVFLAFAYSTYIGAKISKIQQ